MLTWLEIRLASAQRRLHCLRYSFATKREWVTSQDVLNAHKECEQLHSEIAKAKRG